VSSFNDFLKSHVRSVCKEIKRSIVELTRRIFDEVYLPFYQQNVSGLLLGEVQSGKTGQMLGIIADAADKGFEVFVLLTSSNTYLQQQTYLRAFDALKSRSGAEECGFCVCSITDCPAVGGLLPNVVNFPYTPMNLTIFALFFM
jgi:hypothetical protein